MINPVMKDSERLFIGIQANEIFDNIPDVLKKLKISAKNKKINVLWSPGVNYHVTLKYLGPTPKDMIPNVQKSIITLCDKYTEFEIKIKKMGAFPDERHSRILWLGVQSKRELLEMQSDLSQQMEELGFVEDERDYAPHLTIGRMRNLRSTKDIISPFVRKDFGKLLVSKLILYKSDIQAHIPVYTNIFETELKSNT